MTRACLSVLTFLTAIALTSCYTYVPSRLETLPIGANVRAQLSTEASLSIGERVGFEARSLTGKLVERTNAGVLLLVRAPATGRSVGSAPLYQRVDVAAPDLLRVDLKVLNKVRTGGLLAALVGAAAYGLIRAFGPGEPGSPVGSPNPVE